MKTIKDETYKGYRITIRAEFKEGSISPETANPYRSASTGISGIAMHRAAPQDSINFEMTTTLKNISFSSPLLNETSCVNAEQGHKSELYEKLNKETDKLFKRATEKIDKVSREKEMTDGLPESLLVKESKGLLHEGEIILDKDAANRIFNIIINTGMTVADVSKLAENVQKEIERALMTNKCR